MTSSKTTLDSSGARHDGSAARTVARDVFFVSDGTGVTAETMGQSVLAQFDGLQARTHRIAFVDSPQRADEALARIHQAHRTSGQRPVVFSTLVDPQINAIVGGADALVLDLLASFVSPLETELGIRSTHTIGRSHGLMDAERYKNRIEAIKFAMAHDDGQSAAELARAEIILVGVSRSGKTPTSLYLAMQYGIKAANYPLTPDDFERDALPGTLHPFRAKLFGLSISPERLAEIRTERRPNSHYASVENCRYEVAQAERLMRITGVRWMSSTSKSIEEIAATILQDFLRHGG